ALMNTVFKPYLRKFVLVFFDDILVYNKSEEKHWDHLRTMLQVMQQHTLFAKGSKCTFAAKQVDYLGHIINVEGVSTDPTKIQAIENWPIPHTGTENIVADALSRINSGSELNAMVLSTVTSELLQKIQSSYDQDISLQKIIEQLTQGVFANNKYQWEGGVLKRKGKLVVKSDEQLRTTIVQHYHVDAVGGHSGTTVTAHRVGSLFYWKRLHKTVKKHVRECDVFQRSKSDLAAYPGLLQPLPIPERICSDISMDFIVGLPKSQGKSVIFVVVDRLKRRFALFHASELPGGELPGGELPGGELPGGELPKQVASWLIFLAALRCMTRERPREWVSWLPLAEFWYNTSKHSSIKVSPYKVVYGQTPPLHNPYVAGESAVESVDRSLHARENAIEMLKFHIKRSQDRIKKYADLKRSKREFEVGMWVYLKLQ
ncbi:ty3-gypsy retrotransposon protein, partial [Tanacetum coccineum]